MGNAITKKQLLEALEGLADDAKVYVYCTSIERDGGVYAYDISFETKWIVAMSRTK